MSSFSFRKAKETYLITEGCVQISRIVNSLKSSYAVVLLKILLMHPHSDRPLFFLVYTQSLDYPTEDLISSVQ